MEDLTFIREDNQIVLVVACHSETKALTEDGINKAFEHSEFYNTCLMHELISEIISLGNEFISEVKDEVSPPGEFTHQIATVRDGFVTISVAADRMSARAKIEVPWGGKPVNMDDIKKECVNTGVSFGVKRSKVEALLQKTFDAEPGDIIEDTIAFGKDPKHGKNAFFKPMVELFSDKIRKPLEIEGGKVDLKDLGDIETVKPGEKIYRKFPPTPGTPGKNVLGELLAPTPGKDAKLETSSGTVIDENDENVLLAKREGLARLIEHRMEVDDVYSLPELTPKQGHVKFNGSVMIAGDVSPEMKIVATGDVIIGGFVEQASIRCRGELTIISGASGKPLNDRVNSRQFNCLLESGNRVNLAFANQVDIVAKRDVFVHKQLSHCNVKAASMKVGQGLIPRGKLIGGSHLLSKGLQVGKLGALSNTPTVISLNRSYEVFRQKEDQLWSKIEPHMERLEELKSQLKGVMNDAQKAEVKEQILELQNRITKMTLLRKNFIQRRRDYMGRIQVEVNETLYGGLTFEIGDKTKINERERGPSIIRLDEYQLEIEPKTN